MGDRHDAVVWRDRLVAIEHDGQWYRRDSSWRDFLVGYGGFFLVPIGVFLVVRWLVCMSRYYRARRLLAAHRLARIG